MSSTERIQISLAAALFAVLAMPVPIHARQAAGGNVPTAPGAPAMTSHWWMFFVSGDNKTPLAKEDAERMQAGHIRNLERMGKSGKALMAGPLGDGTRLRGIVVLTVDSLEELRAEFRDDPYVKAGRLKIEAYRWSTRKDAIGKPSEPIKMEQYQLVILKKGPKWTAEDSDQTRKDQEGHLRHIEEMLDAGDLALAGPLAEAGDLRGLLVFRTNDADRIQSLLAADPHLRSGRLIAERHPLYVAKGCLGDPKPAPQ
jgi:uncharacterized protein YciI